LKMSTNEDTIGIARDHRWMRVAEQQKQLKACSRAIITLGETKGRDGRGYRLEDAQQLIRPGTVVQLMFAFLLADGRSQPGKPAKMRRATFDKALAVVEKRKGIVRDMLTGLSTETPAKRLALKALAYDQIARNNRGASSAENGARSRGRPRQWFDPARRKIVWEEWHSSAHATNTEAADEASRRLGTRITHYTMWRIVKEMREAKGLKGTGASGRRPNSAAATLATAVGKPDPNRPLPKARVRKGVVYFLKNGVRGQVKIGFTENLKGRISSLQGATPDAVAVIGTIPGTRKTEMKMHKRFAEYRVRREWFRIEGSLAKFLKDTFPKFKRT
jgi:transposase